MYLQNKVFSDDNIMYEFSKKQGYLGGFVDSYSEIIKFIENTFRVKFDENVDLEDVHIGELLQLFGDGFYNRYITHDNSYVLKKHQKISAMKDKLVKEDVLKMICK
jgi:hypothetical protein